MRKGRKYERMGRERDKEGKSGGNTVAFAKEKSLKKSENKGEGACLLPRWPYHQQQQELLINAKKAQGGAAEYRQGQRESVSGTSRDFREFSSYLTFHHRIRYPDDISHCDILDAEIEQDLHLHLFKKMNGLRIIQSIIYSRCLLFAQTVQ